MCLVIGRGKAVATVWGMLAWFVTLPIPGAWAKQPLYYPSKVGDTYVVQGIGRQKGGQEISAEMTGRVVAVSEGRDGVEVTTEFVGGTFSEPTTRVRITDRGIFLLKKGDRTFDPPINVLPSPLKLGTSWEIPKSTAFPAPLKYVVGKEEEEVEVPAGKFKAVRIDGEAESDGVSIRRTEWYVPNVGPVKIVTTGSNGSEVTLVLKSFNPGKK